MCLRTFFLLVVVRSVWMKVTKTDFVDESEPSLQYLDPSSPVTSLDVLENDINALDVELNDITSKMNKHTVEAIGDNTTETTEVMAEAIRINEPSEEKVGFKTEDILDMSEATKEGKQVFEMEPIPQTIINNIKISDLTELTGEESEEKKDDAVDVRTVKNENLSSKAVTEKLENNEKPKEEIMESSKMNDEDQLTSKEIAGTNESNIKTLGEELSDIKTKMKEHNLEAMADDTTETTEMIAEAIRTNVVYQLLEPSEQKMDDKIEDMSEATKEAKQIPQMMVTPQTTVNNENESNLTKLTGEQSDEKKDDSVDMTNVNEKLSPEAVARSNLIELLNEKEGIKDSSNANVEDELTSKEITKTNDAIGMTNEDINDDVGITIEEMMEKKSEELLQELLEENDEDFMKNSKIHFDSSAILDIIISEELSSMSGAHDGYKLPVNSPQEIHEMEEDAKFIDEMKEEINFLEESMNKHDNTFNLHMVELDRIEDANEKIESESKIEGSTIRENSVHKPLWVKNFKDVVDLSSGEFIRDHVHETWPSKDFENFENPIKVKNYKEKNNVDDQKYSLRPEGVDLWFPVHKEDLDHEEDSAQITQTENGEKAQDDIPKENTADQVQETPAEAYKEKINPNIKLLLKRTGFWKDDDASTAQKHEERSSWLIVLVGLPLMLLVLMLAVLMGIILLTKTEKKPTIFIKSLNLWGNDYDRMKISSIKKPKYNKMK